jgi:hypothetical protein
LTDQYTICGISPDESDNDSENHETLSDDQEELMSTPDDADSTKSEDQEGADYPIFPIEKKEDFDFLLNRILLQHFIALHAVIVYSLRTFIFDYRLTLLKQISFYLTIRSYLRSIVIRNFY